MGGEGALLGGVSWREYSHCARTVQGRSSRRVHIGRSCKKLEGVAWGLAITSWMRASWMRATTCWMLHGKTWSLLDALGYFLVVIC